jgi:protein-S-isoprenylcysteine O-methyltransferase Ste14
MLKRILQVTAFLILYAVVYFAIAGRADIPQAWAFFTGYLLFTITLGLVVRDPNLFKERTRGARSVTQTWDRVILGFNSLGMIGIFVIAALDAGRYGWQPTPSKEVIVAAFAVFYTGGTILIWSMRTNTFFSTVVRIQEERGHHAITVGPYRIVRHPGYVGMLLMILTTPLALGSYWGLLSALVAAAAMVVRTAKEDALLQRELDGYAAYADQTTSRLLPGIW